jgi:hypothetical protein
MVQLCRQLPASPGDSITPAGQLLLDCADQVPAAASAAASHAPCTAKPALQHSISIRALCSWCWRGLPQTCAPHHTDDHAIYWLTGAHASVVGASLIKCRHLFNNQLTGTLPAAWSALTGLGSMWVPCALLSCACLLAVSAAWQLRAAGTLCSCINSCQPTQGTASSLPADCLLVQISCLQWPLQQPVMPLAQPSLHCSAAAPTARFAAGVGGAYRRHGSHIRLMCLPMIDRHAPMSLM